MKMRLAILLILLGTYLTTTFSAEPPNTSKSAVTTEIKLDDQAVHAGIRSYTVTSAYQKGPNKLEVLLPDDYSPTNHYRVLYLLPVNAGGRPVGQRHRGGALGLFLMHTDTFGKVAVFDSFVNLPKLKFYKEWGLAETYGPMENYDRYEVLNLFGQQKSLLQKGPCRITILAGGPGSRIGVDALQSKLKDNNIPYIYILGSTMPHTWTSGWLAPAVASISQPEPVVPAKP